MVCFIRAVRRWPILGPARIQLTANTASVVVHVPKLGTSEDWDKTFQLHAYQKSLESAKA
ncbi:MAG: hypothetical protein R6U98_13410 [Pirellulaceae bacterium]